MRAFIYIRDFLFVFLAVKDIYNSTISGKIRVERTGTFRISYYCRIPGTIIFGRFFCAIVCSFGQWVISCGYIIHTLKPRFVSVRGRPDSEIPQYAVFAGLVLIGWTFAVFDFDGYSSPMDSLCHGGVCKSWSQPTFLLTVGALLLLIIIAGSL